MLQKVCVDIDYETGNNTPTKFDSFIFLLCYDVIC